MKNTKIANLLKFGLFLFGISLLLWNCEDNDNLQNNENIVNQIKNKINTDDLSLVHLQDNIIIDWNNYQIINSDNTTFYQFNIEFINPIVNNTSKLFKSSPIFSLIAFKQGDNLKVNLLESRAFDYSSEIVPQNFINLGSFSGSLRYYNNKGVFLNKEAYVDGILIKTDIKNYFSINRDDLKKVKQKGALRVEPCNGQPSILDISVTTHHYMDYYNATHQLDSSGSIIPGSYSISPTPYKSVYLGSTTERYTYTTFSCDTPHTGDTVYKSEYLREQKIIDCGTIENNAIDINGNCIELTDDILDVPPSCKSFNFQNTALNWQEASIINLRFNIVLIEIIGGIKVKKIIQVHFYQPVKFGMPRKFANGTIIPQGLAAEISARAISHAIDDTISKYNNLAISSSDLVRNFFQERLKLNFQDYSNGGRVNFNDMSSITNTTEYKTYAIIPDNCY